MRLGKPIEHLQAALRATLSSGPIQETITTIARQIGYFGYLSTDAVIWVWDSFAIHERYHIFFLSIGTFHKIHNFESRKGEKAHKDFLSLLVSGDTFQSRSWRVEGKKHPSSSIQTPQLLHRQYDWPRRQRCCRKTRAKRT
jgi:Peroxisomal biogenesis factor 11 (PEX11)